MRLRHELESFIHAIGSLAKAMFGGWIRYILARCREIREVKQRRDERGGHERGRSKARCIPVDEDRYRRPDPMLYSQYYLMSQGIAVTWDNPDIAILKGGALVSSTALDPDTDYEIVARIWNNSTNAPAVHLPVFFAFLDFGIGMTVNPIGQTFVNLPVKGAPGHPTFAHMPWHTPATAGHYCILVGLIWSDDANPYNNLGQENLEVGALHSPAQFRFPVRNGAEERRLFRFEVDGYRIPDLLDCEPDDWGKTPEMTREEIERLRLMVLRRNGRGHFPMPNGWRVEITPPEILLAAQETREIVVDVHAPDGFTGAQTVNVNAFHDETLVGGVTLQVTG